MSIKDETREIGCFLCIIVVFVLAIIPTIYGIATCGHVSSSSNSTLVSLICRSPNKESNSCTLNTESNSCTLNTESNTNDNENAPLNWYFSGTNILGGTLRRVSGAMSGMASPYLIH